MQDLSLSSCLKALAPRSPQSHKGDFGHVVVIGGDLGYGGSIRLCAEAALRVGAGLVSVLTRREHIAVVGHCPELMCHGIESAEALDPVLERATVIAVGPGLGQSAWSQMMLQSVAQYKVPIVCDADALVPEILKKYANERWVLTPHPGEASRLLQISVSQIQDNRAQSIRLLRERYPATVVLKGHETLVLGSNQIYRCINGNPAMASAGMGDVLTGMIAGLVAQGISCEQAACLGVVAHACAGDLAAEDLERGLLASDLLSWVPLCLTPDR